VLADRVSKLPKPTPLVFKCQTAIRDTAEAFWGNGWKLHDLKIQDAGLHKQLIDLQRDLTKACGRDDEVAIVRVTKQLIELWKAIAAAMPAETPKTRTWA